MSYSTGNSGRGMLHDLDFPVLRLEQVVERLAVVVLHLSAAEIDPQGAARRAEAHALRIRRIGRTRGLAAQVEPVPCSARRRQNTRRRL